MVDARRHAIDSAWRSWGERSVTPHAEHLVDDLDDRLTLYRGQAPARVLKSDIPFPTSRTTEFQAGEGSITFTKDSNTVSFDTGQYRNVSEKAHNSPAGSALFAKLKTVKWTRGSGGIFNGDNEINEEDTYRGQYVTTAYGPIAPPRSPHTARSTPIRRATVSPVSISPRSSRSCGTVSGSCRTG